MERISGHLPNDTKPGKLVDKCQDFRSAICADLEAAYLV
jgi:hypothetical protein